MIKGLVSVIITSLNAEKYIGRALNSVIEQKYNDIEIIVVDAGSKDKTKKICSYFKIVKFFNLLNSSMGEARNYGIKKSKGEYIMFLDCDDFYCQNKINFQVNKLKQNQSIDFVANTAYIIKDKKKKFIGIKKFTIGKLKLKDFLEGKCYSLGALCIRKEALINNAIFFHEGKAGYFGEDWSFQLKLSIKELKYIFFKNPLLIIDLREDSFTQWENQYKMKETVFNIVNSYLSEFSRVGKYHKNYKLILDKLKFKLSVSYFLNSRSKDATIVLNSQSNKNLKAFILKLLAFILPSLIFSYFLKLTWKLTQNKSFTWLKRSKKINKWILINNKFLNL